MTSRSKTPRSARPAIIAMAVTVLAFGLMAALLHPYGRAAVQRLSGEAAPAVIGAAGIDSGVERLAALANRLTAIRSAQELAGLETEIDGQITAMDTEIARVEPLLPDWQTDLIRREIALLGDAVDQAAALARTRLELDLHAEALAGRLSLLNMQGLGWVEERMAEAAAQLPEGGEGAQAFETVLAYSQLRNLAHRVNEQLRFALDLRDGRPLDWVRADLSATLDAAKAQIAALPEAARAGVAPSFVSLAALATGPEGILTAQAERAELQARLVATMRVLDEAAARVAGVTGQLESQALVTLSAQSNLLSRALNWGLFASVGLAMLGLLLAGAALARLQQLPRAQEQAALLSALENLAAGDTDQPVAQAMGPAAPFLAAVETARQQIQGLETSNAELDRFAAEAAHDLRAPISAIAQRLAWLREDHGAVLPKDIDAILGELGDRCTLMHSMLCERLAQGREACAMRRKPAATLSDWKPALPVAPGKDDLTPDAAKPDQKNQQADAVETVEQVFDLLRADDRFSFKVTGKTGLRVADAPLLSQILINLVSNAIRHHDRGAGEVLIAVDRSSDSLGSAIRLRIVDDGPGIALTAPARKMLEGASLEAGSAPDEGMGLATVHRLVTRVGGSIDLVSDPDKFRGTAFMLLWPCAVEARDALESPQAEKEPLSSAEAPLRQAATAQQEPEKRLTPAKPDEKPPVSRRVRRAA
ncbi:MAG: sensor histidine kinase [Pseudomonadota bacterium]